MFSGIKPTYLILTIGLLVNSLLFAQDTTIVSNEYSDTIIFVDSIARFDSVYADSLTADSLSADSLSLTKKRKSALDSEVKYLAKDSIRFDVINQKAYLYGEAKVNYTDIELTAEYMEVDLDKQEIFASGVPDTSGNFFGIPNFTQGSQTFDSDSLHYNFKTEKGVIFHVVTEQGDGYLHSARTKRANTGHIHVKDGKYTTCNADHPHFYLALTKAMVIPEDKIIAGPSYLVLEDIPIPLGLPFGFFPNSRSRSSGVLIPSYGEEQRRGFFLKRGGWYQVLGDHADMTTLFDVYSKGSWAIRNTLSYKARYKFRGRLAFSYALNDDNTEEDFEVRKDYRLTWNHSQDAKANPTQSFSANVNFSSSKYDRNNDYTYQGGVTNNKSSSINFSKSWPGTPFNLSLSALASQNSRTETTSLNLPSGSFNANRVYPFRKKDVTGKKKWYEDIGFSYSSTFKTQANQVPDSILFKKEMFDTVDFGFNHRIPFFINIKTGKLFTISPSLSYQGGLTNWQTEYVAEAVLDSNGTTVGYEAVAQRIDKFGYAHAINPTIGVAFTPKFFGMYASKKEDGYFVAVRHVLSPRVSANYTPDMRKINPNYYDTLHYVNTSGEKVSKIYSRFKNPPSSNGQRGSISFGLSNTLEAKVRPRNDTTGEGKKITLLENFNFTSSYNPFAPAFKWGTINWTGGTRILNKKLDLRVSGNFDLYDIDSLARRVEEFRYDNTGQLARLTNFRFTTRYRFTSGKDKKGDESKTEVEQEQDAGIYQDPTNPDLEFIPGAGAGSYVDFNIPWSININYGLTYTKPGFNEKWLNTLGVSGDFNLTPKWKFGYRANYDFDSQKITAPHFSIHRDLHCWEMRISIIPFGNRKSYTFTINAKSTLLRDLKLDKKQNWYDNF